MFGQYSDPHSTFHHKRKIGQGIDAMHNFRNKTIGGAGLDDYINIGDRKVAINTVASNGQPADDPD